MATRNALAVLVSKSSYFAYQRTYLHSFTISCKIPRETLLNKILRSNFFVIKAKKTSKNAPGATNGKVNDNSKAKLIKDLNFQSDDEARPFYKLSVKTLLHIYKTTKKDEECGYCKNRLYYIADHIKCPPLVLSQQIVRRTFIYNLSFDWLESSLQVLLDMGVTGDRILRDLWVLKYHHNTIKERLQRVKDNGVENLYPWMVRCSEDIMIRYIQIFQETKSILGDNKSTKMYLANRLNISPEIIEDMYLKVPALKTTRAAKVKKFLDFLLEQGFSLEEITNKARILTASQNTVKQRLEKLRALGLREINLNVLCRSRKEFQKYCESIESITKEQL
ncbi:transcription termination factor, mitochondrial isoform X1 [Maniola jurtina]|uniref:transcription termination factor, mitochondrial isoform X1 n=1 Tax=Maniola jurtina TaxID=191418 RepID=UPI001E68B3FB|nr:transcription termination factor, mitochondrial isoform X1 [Maniola jurtina]